MHPDTAHALGAISIPHPAGIAAYGTTATLGVFALWLAWWLNKHVARNLANLPGVSRDGAHKADPFICYVILALDMVGSMALASSLLGSWVNRVDTAVSGATQNFAISVMSLIAVIFFLMLLTHVFLKRDVKASTRFYARALPLIVNNIPGGLGLLATAMVNTIGAAAWGALGHVF